MKSKARRSFLKALGAGTVSVPFVGMLSDSVAQADGEQLPLKFIATRHPHGVSKEYWEMRADDREESFNIGYQNCSLQPFDDPARFGKSYKDKILIVEGLDHMPRSDGHIATGTILTGSSLAPLGPGGYPANASLDQFLAVEHGLGAETRVASVALSVGGSSGWAQDTLSYGAGGVPLPPIGDPAAAFEYLFAGFVVSEDPVEIAKAARERTLGKSLIDFIRGDINRMKPKLAPREKAKLDQHLTSLRELEKQFEEGVVGAGCRIPSPPDTSKYSVNHSGVAGGPEHYEEITDSFIDLLAQAMACDITRFGTLLMNDTSFAGNPYELPADIHSGVAHMYKVWMDPASALPLAIANKYNYSHVARLMQRLDEFGVLDSTLIYSSSEMGNPSLHTSNGVPTVFAGGANGKFRMGRRLRVTPDCPPETPFCSAPGGGGITATPSNRALVSIAQAFGIEVDAFGTQPDASNTGTLDGLV